MYGVRVKNESPGVSVVREGELTSLVMVAAITVDAA